MLTGQWHNRLNFNREFFSLRHFCESGVTAKTSKNSPLDLILFILETCLTKFASIKSTQMARFNCSLFTLARSRVFMY